MSLFRISKMKFILLILLILCLSVLLILLHPDLLKQDTTISDDSDDEDWKQRLPKAILLGVNKAGTLTLMKMMNLHPFIEIADTEVHFFDLNYSRGLEWYRRQMPYSTPEQITIEKTPIYYFKSKVPQRIKKMNPETKLLLLVRDPVTRAISDYVHSRSKTPEQLRGKKTYMQEWNRTFEELAFYPDGSINELYKPLKHSCYDHFLPPWLDVFPREQLLVVNGDQLIKDPLSQLTKIETFLGLEHKIRSDNFYFNATKGFFCLRTSTQEKCMNKNKGRPHPNINETALATLRHFYVEHNRRFYELIGEDLGWPEE